jgi:hypothetical protein
MLRKGSLNHFSATVAGKTVTLLCVGRYPIPGRRQKAFFGIGGAVRLKKKNVWKPPDPVFNFR